MDKKSLYRFFSNEASEQEEKQIIAWIEEHPDHQKILLKERRIFDATILFAEEKKSQQKVPRPAIPYLLKEIGKIAAIALVIIGIGYLYLEDKKTELLSNYHTLAVPAGQRIDFTLPDGSHISINALSELAFPTVFGKERRVQLKGEAYFEVMHNPQKPFIIETGTYDVEVLGTTFNLRTSNEGDKFSLSLLEGKVKITNREDKNEQVTLLPNQHVTLKNGKLVTEVIEDYDALRWRDGLFCFRNMSLTELLPEIEKYYDVKIVAEKNIPDNVISGKIRVSDGVEHALRVLQKTIPFSYSKDEQIIYIE